MQFCLSCNTKIYTVFIRSLSFQTFIYISGLSKCLFIIRPITQAKYCAFVGQLITDNSENKTQICSMRYCHVDVIKRKHLPCYQPLAPVNFPHKGQWRGALIFHLICAWINGWQKNREAGDLRRHRAHYDVTIIQFLIDEIRSTCCYTLLCCHTLNLSIPFLSVS